MFYVYVIDSYKYITINKKNLKIGITSDIRKAAYWVSKSAVKTWDSAIKKKFETAELREATLEIAQQMEHKEFPNGFTSWMETHHEVVSAIAIELNKDETTSQIISEWKEAQGTGGMYELAKELTDKFEKANKGREWDGDFFDEIEAFLKIELA